MLRIGDGYGDPAMPHNRDHVTAPCGDLIPKDHTIWVSGRRDHYVSSGVENRIEWHGIKPREMTDALIAQGVHRR